MPITDFGYLLYQFECAVAAREKNTDLSKSHVFDTDHHNARHAILDAIAAEKPAAEEIDALIYAAGRVEGLKEAADVARFSLAREPAGWPLRDPTPQEISAAILALAGETTGKEG